MKNKKILRAVVFLSLLLIILWNVGLTLFTRKDTYLSHNYWANFPTLKTLYINSQYVNKHPKGWIPDETVNAYAGGAYIKGTLPQLIAPDTPPLGRYLIGLSAITFNNENISVLIAFVASLFLIYFLGLQVFSDPLLALIPIAGVTSEPILLNQLVYTPLLDIFQLAFLLTFFIFFNKGLKSKNSIVEFLTASFFLGCFIATKFFITGVVIIIAGALVLVLRKKIKATLLFLLSTILSVFILLLTYVRSFAFHYSLRSFLGIQKWVFLYHKSQLILPFSIWPLLMANKWYVWFGNTPVISDPQWRVTWPIITVLSMLGGVLYLLQKIKVNQNVEILLLWSVGYLLFFSFGEISSRYLIILLPVLYILATFTIVEVVKLKLGKSRKKANR